MTERVVIGLEPVLELDELAAFAGIGRPSRMHVDRKTAVEVVAVLVVVVRGRIGLAAV